MVTRNIIAAIGAFSMAIQAQEGLVGCESLCRLSVDSAFSQQVLDRFVQRNHAARTPGEDAIVDTLCFTEPNGGGDRRVVEQHFQGQLPFLNSYDVSNCVDNPRCMAARIPTHATQFYCSERRFDKLAIDFLGIHAPPV